MGDKYVITAAHCVYSDSLIASLYGFDLQVRVGDTSLDEEFEATSFTLNVAKVGSLKFCLSLCLNGP